MRITVQYFASVRELVNLREEAIDVADGASVKMILELLATRHGAKLKDYLFDHAGNPHPYLQFIVDEQSIAETGGLSTVLKNGSRLAIIPPVGGG